MSLHRLLIVMTTANAVLLEAKSAEGCVRLTTSDGRRQMIRP